MKTFTLFKASHLMSAAVAFALITGVFAASSSEARAASDEQIESGIHSVLSTTASILVTLQADNASQPLMAASVDKKADILAQIQDIMTRVAELQAILDAKKNGEVDKVGQDVSDLMSTSHDPLVETGNYSFDNTKDSQVRLFGEVDPGKGKNTVYWFEWAESEHLLKDSGSTSQRNYTPKYAVSEPESVEVVATMKGGFVDGWTYYYRIGAENKKSRVYGEVKSFTWSDGQSDEFEVMVDVIDTDTEIRINDGAPTQGVYTVEFEVTAVSDDVYLKADGVRSAHATTAPGAVYRMAKSDGSNEYAGPTDAELTSTADEDMGHFHIPEGETETFTLTVVFTSSQSDFYFMELTSLNVSTTVFGSVIESVTVENGDTDMIAII